MCDPVTLLVASAVLTAGGYGAKYMGQQQVDRARSSVYGAESQRQRQLDAEMYAAADRSRGRFDDAGEKTTARANDLEGLYRQTSSDVAGSEPAVAPTDSNIVNVERGKQIGKANAFSRQQEKALANLRSFGDMLGEAGRGVQRDSGQIGTIASMKRGSAAVLPLELEAANSAGDTWKLFGDVLGGIGGVGLSAGLSGSLNPSAGARASAGAGAGATPPSRVGSSGRLAGPI